MIYKNETITIADTAKGFTAANLALAKSLYGVDVKKVTCTLETGQIRIWEDGIEPTATSGHIINIGDMFIIEGVSADRFKAIRTGDVSGIISVAYEI